MKRIRAKVTLSAWGRRPGRKAEIEAIIDPLVYVGILPPDLVACLEVKVNRRHWSGRPRTWPVIVRVAGRCHIAEFEVGQPGCVPMLGATVMAALDLVADPLTGYLTVNPASPDQPTVRL